MNFETAEKLAAIVVSEIEPYCSRIMVCGSVRRKRPQCHDIDIVLIPSVDWKLVQKLRTFGDSLKEGAKIIQRLYEGEQIDFYIANAQNWGTLVLIRTGSKEHNIKLCRLAMLQGMMLKASGEGLFKRSGERIAGDTEESIFAALGLNYIEPHRRETAK